MPDAPDQHDEPLEPDLTAQIGAKEDRKLETQRKGKRPVWFGLGMFGMVGWSVAVPAVVGVSIGLWLDSTFPTRISWTLTGLFAGLAAGAMIAWNWVARESEPD